jgi:hypothetical protein
MRPLILGLVLLVTGADAQSRPKLSAAVSVEIAKANRKDALIHWKITNTLDVAVYVYDFYLWGPAYHIARVGDRVTIETTPIIEQRSCPPDRFPPVLLLVIGPKRAIDGDFSDPQFKSPDQKLISLRIAVVSDPYSVVKEAERFSSSHCQHSPYDAIVRWGTIIDSNTVEFRE